MTAASGSASAMRRHQHVVEEVGGDVEAQAHDAFDEIELRHEGQVEAAARRGRISRRPARRRRAPGSAPGPRGSPAPKARCRSPGRRRSPPGVSRQRVATKASVVPSTTAMTSASRQSSSVAGRRSSTMVSTFWRSEIEVPKSPCSTLSEPDDELLRDGLVEAVERASAGAMSACVAPGGSIMAMGLPGATRMTTKTMTATPNSVISVVTQRVRIARSACHFERSRLSSAAPIGLPRRSPSPTVVMPGLDPGIHCRDAVGDLKSRHGMDCRVNPASSRRTGDDDKGAALGRSRLRSPRSSVSPPASSDTAAPRRRRAA